MNRHDDLLFERITELVSLLSRSDEDMTVSTIARLTETGISQTKRDLALLHRYGIHIHPEQAAAAFWQSDDSYDHTPLSLASDLPMQTPEEGPLLFLNPIEYGLFYQKELVPVKIKDSPAASAAPPEEHAKRIEEAIAKNCFVRFRYRRGGASASESVETAPRKLYFNATDGLWYALSLPDDENIIVPYRLDRILFDVRVDPKKPAPPLDPDDRRLLLLPYVWGADFSAETAPVHVKIRIEPNTPNLLGKIRSDTACREHAKLTCEGDFYYYEDDVIGLNSFRSWLMSFGSSVKVLEPKALAARILLSSKQRLRNYVDGMRFHEYP